MIMIYDCLKWNDSEILAVHLFWIVTDLLHKKGSFLFFWWKLVSG